MQALLWLAACGGSDDDVPRRQRDMQRQGGGAGGSSGGTSGSASKGGAGSAGTVAGQGAGSGEPMAGVAVAGQSVAGSAGVVTGGGEGGGGPVGVFDAGSDPNRNKVQAGGLCTRLAQIQCAGEQFCCSAPGRDRAACESEMLAGCQDEIFLDAISENRISAFDPARAETAFNEFERLASACDPGIAEYGSSAEGLMGIFRGTVEAGESCAPGLNADQANAAAKLASCTNIETTACLPMSALTWRCEARGGAGAACFTDVNCQAGLYCPNPELKFGVGECTARVAAASSCTYANECASLFCRGSVCVEPSADAAYCLAQ